MSFSARMTFVGRLPSNTRCGTTAVGRSLGAHLLLGLAEGERLRLREDVRHEDVVVVADRVQRLPEPDEVDRDELRPLVDELVEAVLAVRPGLAPVDRARLVVDEPPVERDVLAVRLHRQLLEVRGEALQVLAVGHHADVCAPKKSPYQTESSPMSTGRFCSSGVVRKCSSIAWKPASSSRNPSGPTASIVESPIAESIE